eukprot:183253_1
MFELLDYSAHKVLFTINNPCLFTLICRYGDHESIKYLLGNDRINKDDIDHLLYDVQFCFGNDTVDRNNVLQILRYAQNDTKTLDSIFEHNTTTKINNNPTVVAFTS